MESKEGERGGGVVDRDRDKRKDANDHPFLRKESADDQQTFLEVNGREREQE